jgi:RimJ/RimL family protein N-acetyltransferase
MSEISIRPVTEEDARQIWLWANEPDTRQASFHSASIPWEEHLEWYHERLRDPLTSMFLVREASGIPVGVVRFHVTHAPGRATVSITIAREYRGRGFGSHALRLATLRANRETGTSHFTACIRAGNEASLRTFMKAGFEYKGRVRIEGQEACRLVLEMGSHGEPLDRDMERDRGRGVLRW